LKIREFFNVEGFDPDKCKPFLFWTKWDENYEELEKPCPVCPIATAAELRGYSGWKPGNDKGVLRDIRKEFGISELVLDKFIEAYDNHRDFYGALRVAESYEN